MYAEYGSGEYYYDASGGDSAYPYEYQDQEEITAENPVPTTTEEDIIPVPSSTTEKEFSTSTSHDTFNSSSANTIVPSTSERTNSELYNFGDSDNVDFSGLWGNSSDPDYINGSSVALNCTQAVSSASLSKPWRFLAIGLSAVGLLGVTATFAAYVLALRRREGVCHRFEVFLPLGLVLLYCCIASFGAEANWTVCLLRRVLPGEIVEAIFDYTFTCACNCKKYRFDS